MVHPGSNTSSFDKNQISVSESIVKKKKKSNVNICNCLTLFVVFVKYYWNYKLELEMCLIILQRSIEFHISKWEEEHEEMFTF